MRIIIDIDNVICDFVSAMIHFVNWKLKTNYRPEDVTAWDFVDSPNIDIEYDQMMKLFNQFFNLKMWGCAKIYPDSKEILDWIFKNHEVIYLTNRPPDAEQCTIDYFEKHNLPYYATHILYSYDDFVCNGAITFINGHSKAKFAKKHGADLTIEDKPKTVQEYLDEGICTALKVEPYNDNIKYRDPKLKLNRCKNLTEFKCLIEKTERNLIV